MDSAKIGQVRTLLRDMFEVAVAAAQPAEVMAEYLPDPPRGRTLVLGAGKAAAAMAGYVDSHWQGPVSGMVVTRHGQRADCGRIAVREAAHPIPDAHSMAAATEALELCADLGEDDLVLCLISGGGSALLALPGGDISLAEKQEINRQLLGCGASIDEINIVRKHLSAIKGGRLALACAPARVVTLLISDVPGDDEQLIASGPTLPDPATVADAQAVIERFQLQLPASALRFLASDMAETPKPGHPAFEGNQVHIIAAPQLSLEAAADYARERGLAAMILSDSVEGESREVGKVLAGIAQQVRHRGQPLPAPCVLLSGGETTVTLGATGRTEGKGGPNSEFALGLALALDGAPGIVALAADTDGIDGSENNAGSVVDETTLQRARERGLDAAGLLGANQSWIFFEALEDLVVTGPTDTNVNDFRAIYIDSSGATA